MDGDGIRRVQMELQRKKKPASNDPDAIASRRRQPDEEETKRKKKKNEEVYTVEGRVELRGVSLRSQLAW